VIGREHLNSLIRVLAFVNKMTEESRTQFDLIEELDQEKAKGFFCLGLVVVIHRTTIKLIFAHDERRLEKLERGMRDGGEPIGMIGFVKESETSGTFYSQPLAEHAGEEWVEDILQELIDEVARMLDVSQFRVERRWLN